MQACAWPLRRGGHAPVVLMRRGGGPGEHDGKDNEGDEEVEETGLQTR